jgi:hypothetical protein
MALDPKRLILLMSIAAFSQAEDHPRFDPPPPERFAKHQTVSQVTAAAEAYETDEQAKPAFGKLNPYKFGALPVLVVIRNDSKFAVSLASLRAEYIGPDHQKIDDTPPAELRFLQRTGAPNSSGIPKMKKVKQPLAAWEIEGRAFSARILPPGVSASGFFYFQTGHRSGSTLVLTGLRNAQTGEELFYFELPLENVR